MLRIHGSDGEPIFLIIVPQREKKRLRTRPASQPIRPETTRRPFVQSGFPHSLTCCFFLDDCRFGSGREGRFLAIRICEERQREKKKRNKLSSGRLVWLCVSKSGIRFLLTENPARPSASKCFFRLLLSLLLAIMKMVGKGKDSCCETGGKRGNIWTRLFPLACIRNAG
jgi:hypothetical protein